MKKLLHKKNILIFGLLFLFSLPSILPLFHTGFFKTDDGDWMIIRFSAFHQALRDGQFPVRFLPRLNFDFGYPVANFLYPGFMYLAEPIHILGFGFVTTIKILFGLSMISSGIFTFLWLRKLFGNHAAIIGSFIYLYAPYHLYDLYVRGSLGEVLSLAVIPFILWQIERKSFIFTTVGLAFLILSHNTLAVLFYPILFLYSLANISISKKRNAEFIRVLLEFMLGISIASFFFLPALFDLQYTVFSKTQISQWQEYFSFSQTKLLGGIITVILLIFAVLSKKITRVVTKREVVSQHQWYLFAIVLLIALFLNLPISGVLWSILLISFIQFPFRLLSLQILCIAFLVPFFLTKLSVKKQYLYGMTVFFLLMIPAVFFLKPLEFTDKGEGFYATNEDTTTVKKEYMPIWVKDIPMAHPEEKVRLPHGAVTPIIMKSNKYVISGTTPVDSKITINTIYFPGWYAKEDGKDISIDTSQGLLQIPFSKGEHTVTFTWRETPLRIASDIISILSIFLLFFLAFRYYKKTT